MPVPTLFVTGVTGYVGGDAITAIYKAHPDWHYRFLVRSAERGAAVTKAFPSNSTLVVGAMADTDLLKAEAQKADIVFNFASSDYVPAVEALAAGLAARDDKRSPGYFIQISGTGILIFDNEGILPYGELHPKIWDDVADIDAITSIPDTAMHRPADKATIAGGLPNVPNVPNVRQAIVSPPTIVGTGRGPANVRSLQTPILIESIRKRGRGFQLGRGLARWSAVHVHDLSNIFLKLAEDAASGGSRSEVWGPQAYYFAENGDVEWGAVSHRVTKKLNELCQTEVASTEVDEVGAEEAAKWFAFGAGTWGASSRSTATRARQLLGWKPTFSDWDQAIDEAVVYEVQHATQTRMQDFAQGHAPLF